LNALEQNVSKTLISLARLCRVKYGRFWLLSGRREIGAEIRELPENTGDLATLEREGESCRKVRRVVGRRREEDVEKIWRERWGKL